MASAVEDQTSGGAVCEQAPVAVGQPPFGSADAAATAEHGALGAHLAGLRRDRPQQRYLELERGRGDALLQRRAHRKPHAGIQQGGGEAAVHDALGIEMLLARTRRDDNAPVLGFDDAIAERPRHRVHGQRTGDERLHEFQPADRAALLGTHDAVLLAIRSRWRRRHCFNPQMLTGKCTKVYDGQRFRSTPSEKPSRQAAIWQSPARSVSTKILVYENFTPELHPGYIGLFGFFKYSFSLLRDYRVCFRT